MRTKIVITSIKNFAIIAMIIFIASCANQTMPGGGPVDRTPPSLAESFPANGAVNVDVNARFVITFDEWINRGGAGRNVALHPRREDGLNVSAKRNQLTITPNSPLDPNTTYILTINTTLRDLRNNAIERPINIIFSTGETLDSGTVSGKIFTLSRIGAPPTVGLYIDDENWEDANYFSHPTYVTQSDSVGVFEFTHLREGRYRIVAFIDQYRSGRVHLGDTVFTSLEQIIHITNNAQIVNLFPALTDTVVVVDSALVDSLAIDSISVDSIDNVDVDIVDTVAVDNDTAIVNDENILDNDVVISDTILADENSVIVDDTTSIITDTTAITDTTTTITPSTLSGFAPCLAGDNIVNRKWMFRPSTRNAEPQIVNDSAGTFVFELTSPITGTLLWFIDDNDDSEITFGNLIPWRSPEQFFNVQGNVEIKRGWDVEDLEVDACNE